MNCEQIIRKKKKKAKTFLILTIRDFSKVETAALTCRIHRQWQPFDSALVIVSRFGEIFILVLRIIRFVRV